MDQTRLEHGASDPNDPDGPGCAFGSGYAEQAQRLKGAFVLGRRILHPGGTTFPAESPKIAPSPPGDNVGRASSRDDQGADESHA